MKLTLLEESIVIVLMMCICNEAIICLPNPCLFLALTDSRRIRIEAVKSKSGVLGTFLSGMAACHEHYRPDLAQTATARVPKIGKVEPIDTTTDLLVSLVCNEY